MRRRVPPAPRRWVWPAIPLLTALLLAPDAIAAARLEVEVEGLSGEPRTNVLALLSIAQDQTDDRLTPERVRALHRRAPQQIRQALAPFGFYRVEIAAELQEPPTADGTWTARYRVTPGSPARIGSIDFQIAGEGAGSEVFPEHFPMRVGEILLHSDWEAAKTKLRDRASSSGFIEAEFTRHQVLIDPAANAALVALHLDTGRQYRLGEVTFTQDLLDERLIRRYLDFAPGDLYDPNVLLALQGRLLGTEYFGQVEIVPRRADDPEIREVPIEVIAQRNKANRFRVGVGYGTDMGPRFSLDWTRRFLNRWGHRFRTELVVSPASSFWNLDYRIPIGDPTRDYLTIKPEIERYESSAYASWLHSIQFAHSRVSPSGWRRNLGFDYRYEQYRFGPLISASAAELVPTLSWSKTSADDLIATDRGYRLRFSLLGTLESVVSEQSYLSGRLEARWIQRFAEDYRVLTRGDLGATWAERVGDLPASRRFYAGGDNSIRGWGLDVLGPHDPRTGEILGGRFLAVGSLELERRLMGRWSAAVFTDFGNAFDPDYEQSFMQSVGMGVRWASPIGPVRLDLAFPLTKDDQRSDGFPPTRLHLVIGPDL